MDAMKRENVKTAEVTVDVIWFFGPRWMKPVSVEYFADYDEHSKVADKHKLERCCGSCWSVCSDDRAAIEHVEETLVEGTVSSSPVPTSLLLAAYFAFQPKRTAIAFAPFRNSSQAHAMRYLPTHKSIAFSLSLAFNC
jgi:hypothetical protein